MRALRELRAVADALAGRRSQRAMRRARGETDLALDAAALTSVQRRMQVPRTT